MWKREATHSMWIQFNEAVGLPHPASFVLHDAHVGCGDTHIWSQQPHNHFWWGESSNTLQHDCWEGQWEMAREERKKKNFRSRFPVTAKVELNSSKATAGLLAVGSASLPIFSPQLTQNPPSNSTPFPLRKQSRMQSPPWRSSMLWPQRLLLLC